MKYLFFDIECANRLNKICEFGYVLTDENFNILKKNDIPMSPGNKQNKNDQFKNTKFNWAYDKDYYFECPKFPCYYESLKTLFEDKNTLIFGWAVNNDIIYLGSEFKRYKLEPFSYQVYDIQKIMEYCSEKNQGLQNAFKNLCPKNEFVQLQPHLSRDDAYMSMRVLQEMLKKLEISVNEIIEICPECAYDANEYLKFKENQKLWKKFVKNNNVSNIDESNGKLCTISKKITENKDVLQEVINYILSNIFIPCDSTKVANIIIVFDENDKQNLIKSFKNHYDGEFILYEKIEQLQKSTIPN